MQFKTFKYTKANGTVSDRHMVVLGKPQANFYGIDVTALEPVEFAMLAEKLNALTTEHDERMAQLLKEFDLTHNRRQFIPEQMTDVVDEWL